MDLYDAFITGAVAEDDIQKIDCKCPKCGRIHKKRIQWSGNGMPRKYCNKCSGQQEYISERSIDWE